MPFPVVVVCVCGNVSGDARLVDADMKPNLKCVPLSFALGVAGCRQFDQATSDAPSSQRFPNRGCGYSTE